MSANNLHELVGQWRATPTPDRALSACRLLTAQITGGGSAQPLLACELASQIDSVHGDEVDVLLGLAQMLIAHGELERAKILLLKATKLGSRAAAPRYLGEILLREGDAVRAVRALRGSLQMGGDDPETRAWYESALAYVPMQNSDGKEAVARAVAAGLRSISSDELPEMLADEPTVSAHELAEPQSYALVEEVSHIDDEASVTETETRPVPKRELARLRGHQEGTAIMSIEELRAAQSQDRTAPSTRETAGDAVDDDAMYEARTVEKRAPLHDPAMREAIERAKRAREDSLPPPIADPETEDEFLKRLRNEGLSLDADGALAKDKKRRGRDSDESIAQERWDAKTKGLEAPPSSRGPDSLPISSRAPVSTTPAKSSRAPRRRKPRYGTWALGVAAALALLMLAVRTGQLPALAGFMPEWLRGPNAGMNADNVTADNVSADNVNGAAGKDPPGEPVATNAAPPTDVAATAETPEPTESAAPVEPPAASAEPVADATPKSTAPRYTPPPRPYTPPPRVAVKPRPQPASQPQPVPKPQPPPSGDEPAEPVWLGDPELNQ